MRYPPALFDAQAHLYQQFHMTHPEAFASGADAWTTPTSLAGPLEVVGNIRFDESDTDELRNAMLPPTALARPPVRTGRICCGRPTTAPATVRTSSPRWMDGSTGG